MSPPTRMNDGEASKSRITVVRTSNNANRLADFEQLAREAAAVICKELNAREFAKLGGPRTWFDLQGAAAYLAVSEQTLSRYVKENTAPPSVKIGNGRRFHRNSILGSGFLELKTKVATSTRRQRAALNREHASAPVSAKSDEPTNQPGRQP